MGTLSEEAFFVSLEIEKKCDTHNGVVFRFLTYHIFCFLPTLNFTKSDNNTVFFYFAIVELS